ncbi:protein IQ-DOMAIN 33 isoform X2 [Rhodamnia argentea]|uniref:Protein IQ-DOMAIN 33 isoform X2 n=1 Tax=Rhodamnia argentea TaxID=178133 RepID=A0A8B8PYB3_9MYRT|nr:protein IQ-DOMAIN 33 isoform X2 [Rhodamnia argentea]
MGLTGELVKSVFSRSRPSGLHEARSREAERRRWSVVRSYLCGDEFNSVLAEEDSASVKSYGATTSPPSVETEPDVESNGGKESLSGKRRNSMSRLFHEDDAAIIIQSAFRRFLARRKDMEDIISVSRSEQCAVSAAESPSKDSIGTSLEVQTGNSVRVFAVQDEKLAISHQKHKLRTQVTKPKEEWDDSTVSSNISKMRIQSRLEATTRRERALAYAFSQQLRICSKKRQTRTEGREPNMSWSWLERWMATRISENSSVGSHTNMPLVPRNIVKNESLDVAGEEKESCGSNEVPVHLNALSVKVTGYGKTLKPTRNRLKATNKRGVSRRKTVPSQQFPKAYAKATRKDSLDEVGLGTDRKHDQQMESKNEIKCDDSES